MVEGDGRGDEQYTYFDTNHEVGNEYENDYGSGAISGLTLGMIQALFYIGFRAAKNLTREMN